ncbi:MAG: type I secretion system permease/ATPase, partial [Novosphingobium sp.]
MPTLLGLFLMLIVLYGFQAVFEFVRGEAMLGIANGIHAEVYSDLHYATSAAARNGIARNSDGLQLIRDFDQLHGFLIGPAPLA